MSVKGAFAHFVAGVESLFGIRFVHGQGPAMSASANNWLRGTDGCCGAGRVSMNYPYVEHAIINQAVSVVAADLASVEWAAYPAKGSAKAKSTPIDEHEVLTWFENPAEGMTRRDLMEWSTIYYLLEGEAIWNYDKVIINPSGLPSGSRIAGGDLELVRPSDVEWKIIKGQEPELLRRENRIPLDLDALTIFHAFNPYGVRGVGKVAPIFHDARADLGASAWNEWQLAERNGIPAMILKPPAERGGSPAMREGVKERWESSFPTSRSGVGVLGPGWDFAEVGVNRKDMEWSEMRSSVRENILAIIGLVPFLAGVLDKANYANAREQKFVYWRGTQSRLLSMYQDKINNDVLKKLGITDIKLYPRWEMVRAAADDVQQKSETAAVWFGMGLSKKVINESLEMGWDPDDIEDYEVQYLPFNLMPADMLGQQPTAETPPGEDVDDDEEEPDEEEAAKVGRRQVALTGPQRLNRWRMHVMRMQTLESPTESIIRSWMHDLEQKVLGRLNGLAGMKLVHYAREQRKVVGLIHTVAEIAISESDINALLFDIGQATKVLMERMTPRIKAAVVTGATDVLQDVGLPIKVNPNDIRLAAKVVEGQMRVRGITATIREQLTEELADGLRLGESTSELSKRIQDVMDASVARADTIARTEMGIAYSSGKYVAMRSSGINQHEWLSAQDDRVRDDHAADDGEVVDIGKPFPHSGLLYPLDPAGPPEQIINCRCTTIPVVTEV